MTIKLPASVLAFCMDNESVELFENFSDYWNHCRSESGTKQYPYATVDKLTGKPISFSDKEKRLEQLILKEASKLAGIDVTSMAPEKMATHPMVSWAIGNIQTQLIDAVLPQTVIDSTSAFCEVKTVGWGQTAIFDIRSRDLFPVSKAGRLGMREGELHRGFDRQETVNPVSHIVTTYVSLFRVLCGEVSLSTFVTKCLRSIETEMYKDIYNAFNDSMADLSTDATTGLQVTGFTMEDMLKLAAKVQAFSGGAKPIMLGTKVALSKVFPDDGNYRYDVESPYMKLGYMRNIAGVDTLEIPNVANWESPFSTYITDTSLWIVAPGTDKIVKCVIGGTLMSNTSDVYANANLVQTNTLTKFWAARVVTSSVGGLITL
jgi:hypothetical protein